MKKKPEDKKEEGILSPIQDVGRSKNVFNLDNGNKIEFSKLGDGDIPPEIKKALDAFVGSLNSQTRAGVKLDGVLGDANFRPYSQSEFDELITRIKDIAVNGAEGFFLVGNIIEDKNPPVNSVGLVKGSLKVNKVSPAHIILTLLKQLNLTREDAIELISNNSFGTSSADPSNFK